MKIVSLVVALCFTMNVFASTGTVKAFEEALDNYQYAINVEWDQRDPAFKEAKTKELIAEMQRLITSGGLNQQDIINVVENKMNNKAAAEALRLKMSLAGNLASPEELVSLLSVASDDFYSRGANWSGDATIVVGVFFAAIIALGVAVWFSATHGCQEYAQTCDQFGCRNNYDVCIDYGYVGPHL